MGNEDPIVFPCDFPIKIMGATREGFREAVFEIVKKHDETFEEQRLVSRLSAKGNYTSYTATIKAQRREQLDALYLELTRHPMVKVVI